MKTHHLKATFKYSDHSIASDIHIKVHELGGSDYDLGNTDSAGSIDKVIRNFKQVSVPVNPLNPRGRHHNIDDVFDRPQFTINASDNQGHSFTTPAFPYDQINNITIILNFRPTLLPFHLFTTFFYSNGNRASNIAVEANEIGGSNYILGNTDGNGNIDRDVRSRNNNFDNPGFFIKATDPSGQTFTTIPIPGSNLDTCPNIYLPFSPLVPFRLKTTFVYSNGIRADNTRIQVKEIGGGRFDLGRTDINGGIDKYIRNRAGNGDHPMFTITATNKYGHSFTTSPLAGDLLNPNPNIILPFKDPSYSLNLGRDFIFPDSGELSTRLRESLIARWGTKVPGCIFYITRNGLTLADGSFNYARLPGSSNGELGMNKETIVHTGSVGKVICLIAFLRLVQEWNEIYYAKQSTGSWPTMSATDQKFLQTIINFNKELKVADSNEKFFTLFDSSKLVNPYLDTNLITIYGGTYPGADIANISLKDIIVHQSGLPNPAEWVPVSDRDDYNLQDISTFYPNINSKDQLKSEPSDGGLAFSDTQKIVTALLKKNRKIDRTYNNYNYVVIGALIEAITGKKYSEWVRERLFRGDSRFNDINRHVTDTNRGARYYKSAGKPGEFFIGNLHPDYENFSADGGWYMSAQQFCSWFDDIMQGNQISGRIVLNSNYVNLISTDLRGAWDVKNLGRLDLITKNGAASPGEGGTNAVLGYLKGYGNERICAFTEVNSADISADAVFKDGMNALKTVLTARPGPIPSAIHIDPLNTGFPKKGLLQSIYWADASNNLKSAAQIKEVKVDAVLINGISKNRTNLFGDESLPPSTIALTDLCLIELQGLLMVDSTADYKFKLSSDDGAVLWINNRQIIDMNDHQELTSKESDISIHFEGNNYYPIKIQWYNAGSGFGLFIEWKQQDQPDYLEIPVHNFVCMV